MKDSIPYQPDALLVKFLLGEATAEEARLASDWIATSSEHEAYFHALRETWDHSLGKIKPKKSDENAAWQRLQERINREHQDSASTNTNANRKIISFIPNRFLRIAATVIVAVSTLAWGFYAYREFSSPEKLQAGSVAHTSNLTLSDGSSIVLNKKSTLTYPSRFTGKQRTVSLKGEGFFKITPNKAKPFIVQVDDLLITVVGTSFNIKETGDKVEVVVETGRVKVSRHNKSVELGPGESLKTTLTGSELIPEKQPDHLYQYYRNRIFECDNTPLWKLVEVLNDAYDMQIIINNPKLRNLPLNTTFNDESLDNILLIISQTFDINVTRESGKIILN